MNSNDFPRDSWAHTYAQSHIAADPGVVEVHYLKKDAPPREIRLLEINDLIADRETSILEPLDFGVDTGSPEAHQLLVLDVTPSQWQRIRSRELALPLGWTLEDELVIRPSR